MKEGCEIVYTHTNLQGGNGNTGIGFYFKLIPRCPPAAAPLKRLALRVRHSVSHLADEMLACVNNLQMG